MKTRSKNTTKIKGLSFKRRRPLKNTKERFWSPKHRINVTNEVKWPYLYKSHKIKRWSRSCISATHKQNNTNFGQTSIINTYIYLGHLHVYIYVSQYKLGQGQGLGFSAKPCQKQHKTHTILKTLNHVRLYIIREAYIKYSDIRGFRQSYPANSRNVPGISRTFLKAPKILKTDF